MLLTEDKEIDLFVGSRIGSFKHIKYHTESSKNNKKCIENLVEIKTLQKNDTITFMEWCDDKQTDILIGRRNQQIQIYNTHQRRFTKTYTADFGTGDVVGLGRNGKQIVAATASGAVKLWTKKTELVIETGGKLDRMRVCEDERSVFGTGGEENDLKLYRPDSTTPFFIAKNLPLDWLQLRPPVGVADMAFEAGQGGQIVAVCSRYGYVRLYDARAQRRPVLNVPFPDMAATCIARGLNERQYLVGFGRGLIQQVDLRRGKPDKVYKGCVGAVTGIKAGHGRIVSVCLDRHLRVHDGESKELVYKQYLTTKLTSVLIQEATSTPLLYSEEIKEEKVEEDAQSEKDDDDLDVIFDSMETVTEKPKKKKKLPPTEDIEAKRTKADEEGSDPPEVAILKLLKSTEKQKRKREKMRRQKKAKSVFHNA